MSAAAIPFAGIVSLKPGSSLRIYDADESHYLGLKCPSIVTTSVEYTLPAVPASTNYLLTSTTAGVMSWLSTVPLNRGGTGTDMSLSSGYSVVYMSPSAPAMASTPANLSTTPMFLKSIGNGAGSITNFGFYQVQFSDLSGSITTAMISNDQITFAKIQNVANQRVLGRNTSGTGDVEEVTLSQLLDWVGSPAQGDILYRNATSWQRLAAGTSGHVLTTQGAGANPTWAAASGGSGLPGWSTPSVISFTSTNATPRNDTFTFDAQATTFFEIHVVAWAEEDGGFARGFARTYRGMLIAREVSEGGEYYLLNGLDIGSSMNSYLDTAIHNAEETNANFLDNPGESTHVALGAGSGYPHIVLTTTGLALTTINWKISIRYLNT